MEHRSAATAAVVPRGLQRAPSPSDSEGKLASQKKGGPTELPTSAREPPTLAGILSSHSLTLLANHSLER